MSKPETMWVAFPNGGILPKDITKSKERPVGPHEAVRVPRTYGQHLVDDRFAYEAEEPKKAKAEGGGKQKAEITELEKSVAQAEEAFANAAGGEEKRLAAAVLDEAKAELAKAQG